MVYMGSKRGIAKEILPIILKDRTADQWYVEPFCGGCNSLCEVPGNRIANDINPYLIAMFKQLTSGWQPPKEINEGYYHSVRLALAAGSAVYPDHVTGWVGFVAGFSGKFFGGYAGSCANGQDYIGQYARNIIAQTPKLAGVQWLAVPYDIVPIPPGSIVYCDPPYAGTTKYKGVGSFDHLAFWQWCRDRTREGCKVFVSEYQAPADFTCVWRKEVNNHLSTRSVTKPTEKLFVYETA